jgi:hypothetical protein
MADQPGGDADQPVPQGGDHRLAVANAVPGQRAVDREVRPAGGCGSSDSALQKVSGREWSAPQIPDC